MHTHHHHRQQRRRRVDSPLGNILHQSSLSILLILNLSFLLIAVSIATSTATMFRNGVVMGYTTTSSKSILHRRRGAATSMAFANSNTNSIGSKQSHRQRHAFSIDAVGQSCILNRRRRTISLLPFSSSSLAYSSVAKLSNHNNHNHHLSHNMPSSQIIIRQHQLRSTRLHSSSSSSTRTTTTNKKQFQEGDEVHYDSNGDARFGIVLERKGGWYSIRDASGGTIVKKRATQMSMAVPATIPTTGEGMGDALPPVQTNTNKGSIPVSSSSSSSSTLEPMSILPESFQYKVVNPPTIIDIDAALLSNQPPHPNNHTHDPIQTKKDKLYLNQCAHFQTYTHWIVFTDLHCQPSTLSTCLTVLRQVHATAKHYPHKKTGVLFLGDFWHQRGTIRVDCLNAILGELEGWTVPMIMIPGNHDQVTLEGGEHSLTPFRNAYFLGVGGEGKVEDSMAAPVPGILIFSKPTKFLNALFLPHIRSITTMQSILQSNTTASSSAIFLHADITGASMNDLIVSTGGTDPGYFPGGKAIYSGHFHKPHLVVDSRVGGGEGGGDAVMRYVGSPYQTTLAEAGQDKFLLVLDKDGDGGSGDGAWKCVEEIPLTVGRKHWTVSSIEELFDLPIGLERVAADSVLRTGHKETRTMVVSGDRVVVSIQKDGLEKLRRDANSNDDDEGGGDSNSSSRSRELVSKFDDKVKAIRSLGASIEIREVSSVATSPMMATGGVASGDNETDAMDWLLVEDMSPSATWSQFIAKEVEREVMDNETAQFLLEAGSSVLLQGEDGTHNETKTGSPNGDGSSKSSMDLCLESVSVKGFGPFKKSITYPLNDRGLVLLRGSSNDLGSDSNGSGKTSLAMSALWALTGSADPRPFGNANTGSNVVNDFSKSARVSLTGTINGKAFIISRSRTSSKTSLTFLLNDVDLTRQSVKETQAMIYEKLGADAQMLSRTIFHGQHTMNGLLEATDSKLKEELSLVLPLALWQKATERARSNKRMALKTVSELDGMLAIRHRDFEDVQRKCENAKNVVATRERVLEAKEQQLCERIADIKLSLDTLPTTFEGGDHNSWFANCQRRVEEAAETVQLNESLFASKKSDQDSKLNLLRGEVKTETNALHLVKSTLQDMQYQVDRSEFASIAAKENLLTLENKWNISDISNNGVVGSFVSPRVSVCPTCKQPMDEDHSHEHLLSEIDASLNIALERVQTSTHTLTTKVGELSLEKAKVTTLEVELDKLMNQVQLREAVLEDKLSTVQHDLQTARMVHMQMSGEFSTAAKQMNSLNELKTIEASSAAELRRHQDSVETGQEAYDDISKAVNDLEKAMRSLKAKREDAHCLSVTMSSLADNFGARGVQTFILQNIVHALQIASQSYLDELSDGSIRLRIELDSGDRIVRNAAVLSPEGTWIERPLSSLSGGQWRRCSFALSLGFSDLVARRGRLRSSILVLDEPLTHLDSVGRDDVGRLLRRILHNKSTDITNKQTRHLGLGGLSVSTILIILQDLVAEELSESFDCIDEVIKTQGNSELLLDGASVELLK